MNGSQSSHLLQAMARVSLLGILANSVPDSFLVSRGSIFQYWWNESQFTVDRISSSWCDLPLMIHLLRRWENQQNALRREFPRMPILILRHFLIKTLPWGGIGFNMLAHVTWHNSLFITGESHVYCNMIRSQQGMCNYRVRACVCCVCITEWGWFERVERMYYQK